MTERFVSIAEFLTEEEIQKCVHLYPDVDAIENEVIKPNMARIEQKLNQENDSRYLAYMVIFAIGKAGERNLN